jgi:hypothetical protein
MSIKVNHSYLTITIDSQVAALSTGTSPEIQFERPDGTRGSWTPTISGSTFVYNVQDGDINKSGIWKLQGRAFISGREFKTKTVELEVVKDFK